MFWHRKVFSTIFLDINRVQGVVFCDHVLQSNMNNESGI